MCVCFLYKKVALPDLGISETSSTKINRKLIPSLHFISEQLPFIKKTLEMVELSFLSKMRVISVS